MQLQKMKMNSKIWMLISVVSFCVMAVGIKEMSNEINSFQIIFYRSLVGLITIILLFKKRLSKPTFSIIKEHLFRNVFHLIGGTLIFIGNWINKKKQSPLYIKS
jgi:drug/metabolite transporter (DMT)-like permease